MCVECHDPCQSLQCHCNRPLSLEALPRQEGSAPEVYVCAGNLGAINCRSGLNLDGKVLGNLSWLNQMSVYRGIEY